MKKNYSASLNRHDIDLGSFKRKSDYMNGIGVNYIHVLENNHWSCMMNYKCKNTSHMSPRYLVMSSRYHVLSPHKHPYINRRLNYILWCELKPVNYRYKYTLK